MPKDTIICDIDGTIANIGHRLHFIKDHGSLKEAPDWKSFNSACIDDPPISDIIDIVKSLWVNYDINVPPTRTLKFFTGRNNEVRKNTEEWLLRNFIGNNQVSEGRLTDLMDLGITLSMRNKNDFREDSVVKLEMMEHFELKPEDVLCIFEDRQSVVDMWRAHGYRVLQVNACCDR